MSSIVLWIDHESRIVAAWHKDKPATVVRDWYAGPALVTCYRSTDAAIRAAKRFQRQWRTSPALRTITGGKHVVS